MHKFTRPILIITIVSSFTIFGFGQAKTLQDLVGGNAGSGETQLASRGYEVHHVTKDEDGSWTYWWNDDKDECVSILTNDGLYRKVMDVPDSDCGHKDGLSTGSKVAIALGAAAAAVGVAAIAHRSHDHDDDSHWEDSGRESDYERGYRDGLYNQSYHNWSNSRDYSSGYSKGVGERRHQTNYHSGWGGYRPHTNVNDLTGQRASSGESQMQSRGFRNLNTFKTGEYSYQTWQNSGSRQCVQIIVHDGRYWSVRDNVSSPFCR